MTAFNNFLLDHIYIETNVVYFKKLALGEEVFIFEFNRFIRVPIKQFKHILGASLALYKLNIAMLSESARLLKRAILRKIHVTANRCLPHHLSGDATQ